MKTTLLAATFLQLTPLLADTTVQEPVFTVSGHYSSRDGRVNQHKFPVEIKLLSTGKFTGTIESWIEDKLSNGTVHLDYFNITFSGIWNMKGKSIQLKVSKGSVVPHLSFGEINGLKIEIVK